MGASIALLVCFAFIFWLFARDVKRRGRMSPALWLPLAWAFIVGSRPVSDWFGYSGVGDEASAYDAGNPLERNVYLLLMAASLVVLWRRRVSLGAVVRDNRWLFVFYLYWALSVLWSDASFIAFKRWFKDLGNVVIVLVILTEDDPIEAAKTVFVRCAYLLIPLSLLFIRYIPTLGRCYDTQGNVMYVGVCPNKNTLGSLVLVSGLFFFWDLFNELRKKSSSRDKGSVWARILLLLMIVWILHIADCATALSCTLIAIGIFFGARLGFVKRNLRFIELYLVLGAVLFLVLDSAFNLRATLLHSLGRDETLTGRTDVWDLLLRHQSNTLLGAGFNSFWSGETLRKIWETVPGIVQAHNGYLDTYLNGGILGVGFLLAWLWSASRNIKSALIEDTDYARVRLAFLCIAVIYNWTEAAFNKNGLLWMVLLLVTMTQPGRYRVLVPALVSYGTEDDRQTASARSAGASAGA
jgi:O-antigen ligase